MKNTKNVTDNFNFAAFYEFEDDFLIKMREEYFQKLIDMLGDEAVRQILTDYIGLEESIKAVKAVVDKAKKAMVEPDPEKFIKKAVASVVNEQTKLNNEKEILQKIVEKIPDLEMKKQDARRGKKQVVCEKYIKSAIKYADQDGKLTDLILRVIVKIGWHEGTGVTLRKFAPLFKVLALHRDKAEIVAEEMVNVLQKYDFISFMVNANQDERFIAHLHLVDKMTLFLETAICDNLGLKPLGDDILQ